ncbi:hypothetical protein [Burkholderia pyrrocinia]|uniref:hypothetical protein n=1 Tax=Burkholderia pyrrocinia TaxID=60550 RepID=UPI002AB11CA2|nr:hypothetical protein [Burkholderia pyrrocinia]
MSNATAFPAATGNLAAAREIDDRRMFGERGTARHGWLRSAVRAESARRRSRQRLPYRIDCRPISSIGRGWRALPPPERPFPENEC